MNVFVGALIAVFVALAFICRPKTVEHASEAARPTFAPSVQKTITAEQLASWQKSCGKGQARSCTSYGRAKHESDPEVSKLYFERGCKLGDAVSCAILETSAH